MCCSRSRSACLENFDFYLPLCRSRVLSQHRFDNTTTLHQSSDGSKCRVFATTLIRSAQQWFAHLQNKLVHSYEQLSAYFLSHIASARKQKCTTLTLLRIKQQEAKSLRSYVKSFRLALLDVPITSDDVLTSAFSQGMKEGKSLKASL